MRTTLNFWPPCPIVVCHWCKDVEDEEGEENIIAGLERSDRVIEANLDGLTCPALKRFAAVMAVPFPALKVLRLSSRNDIGPFLPATFLGESAPSLKLFSMDGIAFRAICNLLLSAHHLRKLLLTDIPINCYVPPQAIVACLSASPHLGYAAIGFRRNRLHPGRNPRPPTTRVVLPALTFFHFEGDLEYMEDLVSRIDVPKLRMLRIEVFDEAVPKFPQLRQFIILAKPLPSFGGCFVRRQPSGWYLFLRTC